MTERGRVELVIGPVGAGKSTWAAARAAERRAVFLDVDRWMVRLFGADPRPGEGRVEWYLERRERVRNQIWDVAVAVLEAGIDVILEYGLVRREEREAFYARVEAEGLELRVFHVDAPRDVRRERVAARNATATDATQVVPLAMFELASDLWEPLEGDELARVVR